jgi:hypothetical protein
MTAMAHQLMKHTQNLAAKLIAAVATLLVVALFSPCASNAQAQQQRKPNILIIWGDDIGWYNISAYNMGMMGYRTPNIDRIAKEGALFTDWYGQQSCTAGRASFITGQSPIRTGLTKVGLPGAPEGLMKGDPTIAELLKPYGYVTGQFGKNHLGDRDEHLPTNHGFDEFFGNLYHLNAEEEPENPDYPKDPDFKKKFGPRGVIHSFAGGKIDDTGPLTRQRMETVDGETTAAALGFIPAAEDDDVLHGKELLATAPVAVMDADRFQAEACEEIEEIRFGEADCLFWRSTLVGEAIAARAKCESCLAGVDQSFRFAIAQVARDETLPAPLEDARDLVNVVLHVLRQQVREHGGQERKVELGIRIGELAVETLDPGPLAQHFKPVERIV